MIEDGERQPLRFRHKRKLVGKNYYNVTPNIFGKTTSTTDESGQKTVVIHHSTRFPLLTLLLLFVLGTGAIILLGASAIIVGTQSDIVGWVSLIAWIGFVGLLVANQTHNSQLATVIWFVIILGMIILSFAIIATAELPQFHTTSPL